MSTCYIGVDPGASGGIALLEDDKLIFTGKVPLDPKDDIDAVKLYKTLSTLLTKCAGKELVVCCEKVQGDSKFGGYRAVRFGDAYGSIKTCLRLVLNEFGCLDSLIFVRPQDWKPVVLPGVMGKKEGETYAKRKARGKKEACAFAQKVYNADLSTKKANGKKSTVLDDNIAEAICIAHYAKEK